MSAQKAIAVAHVSKYYRIWETPSARLKAALAGAAAPLLPPAMAGALQKSVARFHRDFFALDDVSIDVNPGESVGIIGLNGSGKSTLLQIIAGTVQPSGGEVTVNGRIAALLELGSGFNPEFTGRENVFLNAAVLGLSRREVEAKFETIVGFADIGSFLDQPVKTYSSGMFVRLAFAVATHVEADVLLIDEALTVGDIFFQQKCYARLNALKERGVAIVLVTHGLGDVEQFCNRAFLLHQGRLHKAGPAPEVVKHYYLLNRRNPAPASPAEPTVVDKAESPVAKSPAAWPSDDANLPIESIPQVSDSTARLCRVALCDARGHRSHRFPQGAKALFYYEFEFLQPVEIPVVGLVLFNNKNTIVHGKNSLEYGCEFPTNVAAGSRLIFRHEVALEIAPGEYTFEVGCASISLESFREAPDLTHFELNDRVYRHCHLVGLGPFEVTFRQQGRPVQLLHHGVANLPGSIDCMGVSSSE